jgi:hypothetical protein
VYAGATQRMIVGRYTLQLDFGAANKVPCLSSVLLLWAMHAAHGVSSETHQRSCLGATETLSQYGASARLTSAADETLSEMMTLRSVTHSATVHSIRRRPSTFTRPSGRTTILAS